MFLTTRQQNIKDFLNACNFIAPEGYTLEYFVTPVLSDKNGNKITYQPPANSGYESTPSNIINMSVEIVPGVTDTIAYTKKDLDATHSFSAQNINLNEIPNEMPKTQGQQLEMPDALKGQGGIIQSPVKLDRRVNNNEQDLQLQEDFLGFPKHTLFHFVKD